MTRKEYTIIIKSYCENHNNYMLGIICTRLEELDKINELLISRGYDINKSILESLEEHLPDISDLQSVPEWVENWNEEVDPDTNPHPYFQYYQSSTIH